MPYENQAAFDAFLQAQGSDPTDNIYKLPNGLLHSSHTFSEGVHFDLHYTPLPYLGYKLSVLSLLRLCAHNGKPHALQFSFSLSARFTLSDVASFWKGVQKASNRYGITLVNGGTITPSRSGLIVHVSSFATCSHFVNVQGAEERDLLYVSHPLGAPYAALLILEREQRIHREHPSATPDFSGQKSLLHQFFHPELPVDVLSFFEEQQLVPKAMTHLTDGLANALFRLCTTNQIGAQLYESKLPISDEVRDTVHALAIDSTLCSLSGGEECGLLCVYPASAHARIEKILHPVGVLMPESHGKKLKTKGGHQYEIEAQAYHIPKDTDTSQ